MAKQPRLSIGIPVYNGERFLEELLMNLFSQTFQDFELVICDNASTDATQDICLGHASKDFRIKYHRNERNLGANPNFNKVFALARAPLFKWAAHDDLYEPSFLGTCIQLLDQNPNAVLAHSDCLCVDEKRRPFAPGPAPYTYIDPRSGFVYEADPVGIAEGPNPIKRFREVLFQMDANTQIFGVIRRQALARTGLQRPFYGTDKLILAELALLGPFMQSREKLYLKRFHEEMSWTLSLAERRKWSNTGHGAYSLRFRQLSGFGGAPFGKGLSAIEVAASLGLVSLLGPKVILKALRGYERKRKAQVAPWRQHEEYRLPNSSQLGDCGPQKENGQMVSGLLLGDGPSGRRA